MSHGGGDDDLAAQAWPGFVDILSSTMIMFVFFLMITATALFFHTIMFKSKLMSQNEKVITERVKEEVQQLVQENKDLKEKIEQMEETQKGSGSVKDGQQINLLQQSTQFAASKEQQVDVSSNDETMVVYFGSDAISLTQDTNEKITQFLRKFEGKSVEATITASKQPNDNFGLTGRKVSVARMLNVRNQLIQAKIDPSKIKAVIVEEASADNKHDWVKIVMKVK
jgi:hypothetical protein